RGGGRGAVQGREGHVLGERGAADRRGLGDVRHVGREDLGVVGEVERDLGLGRAHRDDRRRGEGHAEVVLDVAPERDVHRLERAQRRVELGEGERVVGRRGEARRPVRRGDRDAHRDGRRGGRDRGRVGRGRGDRRQGQGGQGEGGRPAAAAAAEGRR